MLTEDVLDFASRSILCWLATVDSSGQPNVSPKEIFAVFDASHVVIANIASPTSVRNLGQNPRVCVSFVDVFAQKGCKIIGRARNVGKGHTEFSHWAKPLLAKAGAKFPVHSAIVVEVERVEPILAPSYRLYPADTTESDQVQAAMIAYGVQPANRLTP
jgi:uncharacterized protein